MRKLKIILLLSLFSVVTLFGQTVFSLYQTKFKTAKSFYDKRDFKDAFKGFLSLSNISPDDPKVNFYLGRSALEIKNYDVAMAAFDRVLIINPNHTRSKLEIARIYFELKQYDLAVTQLDLVLQNNLPENVRANVLKFKSNIENSKKRNFISASITLGADYDNNANNDIGDKKFYVPLYNVSVSGNQKRSDSAGYISININDLYYFKEYKHLSLYTTFGFYTKANNKISINNSMLFSLSTTPSYTDRKYKISLPISLNKVILDQKGYSHSLSAALSYRYILSPTSNINTAISYSRSYNEKSDNQDSKSKSVSISYKKAFGKNPLFLTASSSYSDTSKIDSGRTDIDSKSFSYSLQLSHKIFSKLTASLSYSHSVVDYDDMDVLFKTKRKDRQSQYTLGFTYNLSRGSLLGLSGTYTDHSSNQAPFVYDKATAKIYYIKSF